MASISLVQPTLIFQTNRYYRHLLEKLRDGNVWDQSPIAIGLSDNEFVFSGTTIPGNLTVEIFHSVNARAPSKRLEVVSDGSGNFSFGIRLQRGQNSVFGKLGDGTVSASRYVNAYNIHDFFEVFGIEFLDQTEPTFEQVAANRHLFTTEDIFGGDPIDPTDEALRDHYGVLTDVLRPEAFTVVQFRQLIQDLFEAYRLAVVRSGIIKAVNAFVGQDPVITLFDVFNTSFRLGTNLKLIADKTGPLDDTLDVIVRKGQYFLNHKIFLVKQRLLTLPSSSTSYIYVDETLDTDGFAEVKQSITFPTGTFKLLGTVITNLVNIISITGCQRIGNDARIRLRTTKYFRYEVLIPNGISLSSEKKGFLKDTIRSVKPAHTTALVRFDDEAFATPV